MQQCKVKRAKLIYLKEQPDDFFFCVGNPEPWKRSTHSPNLNVKHHFYIAHISLTDYADLTHYKISQMTFGSTTVTQKDGEICLDLVNKAAYAHRLKSYKS